MRLLIKLPTRDRPQQFLRVLELYQQYLSGEHQVNILISADDDDAAMNSVEMRRCLAQYKNVIFRSGPHHTKIEAANSFISEYDFDAIIGGADDLMPVVRGYDAVIAEAMQRFYPDTDGLLCFSDGVRTDGLNTHPVFGRKYYERFGYLAHPSYISLWADNELTEVGNLLGKQTYIATALFRHLHPAFGLAPNDALYQRNDQFFQADRDTYLRRREIRFGLVTNQTDANSSR